jgi:hypothetical protein
MWRWNAPLALAWLSLGACNDAPPKATELTTSQLPSELSRCVMRNNSGLFRGLRGPIRAFGRGGSDSTVLLLSAEGHEIATYLRPNAANLILVRSATGLSAAQRQLLEECASLTQ